METMEDLDQRMRALEVIIAPQWDGNCSDGVAEQGAKRVIIAPQWDGNTSRCYGRGVQASHHRTTVGWKPCDALSSMLQRSGHHRTTVGWKLKCTDKQQP